MVGSKSAWGYRVCNRMGILCPLDIDHDVHEIGLLTDNHQRALILEAEVGIEPAYTALQAAA